jgi:hypothetical protein
MSLWGLLRRRQRYRPAILATKSTKNVMPRPKPICTMEPMVTGVADCVTCAVVSDVVEGREFSSAAVGGVDAVDEITTVVRTVTVDVIGSVDKDAKEDVRLLGSTLGMTKLGVGTRGMDEITNVETDACQII